MREGGRGGEGDGEREREGEGERERERGRESERENTATTMVSRTYGEWERGIVWEVGGLRGLNLLVLSSLSVG